MRTAAVIAVCIALGVMCGGAGLAAEQSQNGQTAVSSSDELHFVSVLTLQGEVTAIDSTNRLVTLRDPTGETSVLEARSEKDLEPVKVGDHLLVRYFEGGQIIRRQADADPAFSLKQGMMAAKLSGPSHKKHSLIATVEAIDTAEQEVTLKAPDGSLETIMVANPEYFRNIKVGDRVGLSHVQALALSLQKSS